MKNNKIKKTVKGQVKGITETSKSYDTEVRISSD